LKRVAQLRAQAVEARQVAFLIEREDMCGQMLRVADEWDSKADQLERLAIQERTTSG
jgi:hypothetical protein